MPLNSEFPLATEISDHGDTEVGVRRALGLGNVSSGPDRPMHASRPSAQFSSDRQKRRFALDGEVPVVRVNGQREHGRHAADPRGSAGSFPTNRLEAAETALKAEREARGRAERSLTEAQTVIRDLQTKLGHEVLARDEAREAARKAEAALAVERDAREVAEQTLRQVEVARGAAIERVQEMTVTAHSKKVAMVKSVGAADSGSVTPASRMTKATLPTTSKKSEPKPVKWWLAPKKGSR